MMTGLSFLPFLWYAAGLVEQRAHQLRMKHPVQTVGGQLGLTHCQCLRMILSEAKETVKWQVRETKVTYLETSPPCAVWTSFVAVTIWSWGKIRVQCSRRATSRWSLPCPGTGSVVLILDSE
jgi:hypothetical protein